MDGHSLPEPENPNRPSAPEEISGSTEDFARLALAGLAATTVMTAIAYTGPMIGMPRTEFAHKLGSKMTGEKAPPGSKSWLLGMAAHFIDGSAAFPFTYGYFFRPRLPGAPWLRGMQCGFGLFMLSQAIEAPLLGGGFFSSRAPERPKAIFGALIGHLVYGCLLGALAGERVESRPG